MNNKIILTLAFALFLPFVSAQSYTCPMGGMMYGLSGSYGGGVMLFSWIIAVFIIIALILLIVWLLKRIKNNKSQNRKRGTNE